MPYILVQDFQNSFIKIVVKQIVLIVIRSLDPDQHYCRSLDIKLQSTKFTIALFLGMQTHPSTFFG